MHVDLDYFYAQCEENKNYSIRGKPVVVCVYSGRTEESGAVSTCNYEARKYGVRAGIPIIRAKKLLEKTDPVFLPINRPLYEEVSGRIMNILRTYADSFEQVGIDEACLDISARANGDFEHAQQMAQEIKNRIVRQENITCSIGIAPNKLLAKIASDYRKPDGLTNVVPENARSFLSDQPVSKIPGVGTKVEEKLTSLQAKTIRELAAIEPAKLIEAFGKSLGSYLYNAARGEDEEPVKEREQPTQLSRIGTLKNNTREIAKILPTLNELSASVAQKLAQYGLAFRSVGVIAILEDLSIHSRSKTLDTATDDTNTIHELSAQLLKEFLQSTPKAVLRRVGVKLSDLSGKVGQTELSQFLKE